MSCLHHISGFLNRLFGSKSQPSQSTEDAKKTRGKKVEQTDVIVLTTEINGTTSEVTLPLNKQSRKNVLEIIEEHIKRLQTESGEAVITLVVKSGRWKPPEGYVSPSKIKAAQKIGLLSEGAAEAIEEIKSKRNQS